MTTLDNVFFELETKESDKQQPEPYITLRSKKEIMYLEAQLTQDGEGVATIMPALLKVLGVPWISKNKDIPAFVMTDRLFN